MSKENIEATIRGIVLFGFVALAVILGGDAKSAEEGEEWKIDKFNTQVAVFIAEDIIEGFTDDIEVLVGPHDRGWSDRDVRVVVPTWVFAKEYVKPGYARYYTCHEMSHQETIEKSGDHGEDFQLKMIELCPEVYHYENEYKAKYKDNIITTEK